MQDFRCDRKNWTLEKRFGINRERECCSSEWEEEDSGLLFFFLGGGGEESGVTLSLKNT